MVEWRLKTEYLSEHMEDTVRQSCVSVRENDIRRGCGQKSWTSFAKRPNFMPVLKRAQTAQRQLNTFVVIPVDISVEFLNKIIQGNARP